MYWDLDHDDIVPDVLDSIHCISMTEDAPVSSLNAAGVDDLTPVDTMMRVNGERAFITDIGGYDGDSM